MSDIKNEIKQALEDVNVLPWQYRELHRTIEYDAIQDANGKNIICISSYDQANVDFLLLAINNIPSLITTIESQKEEIEKAVAEIKFQVERNDKQREAYFATEKLYFDQKAITELAVNVLKKIANEHYGSANTFTWQQLTKSTLSEIERFSQ